MAVFFFFLFVRACSHAHHRIMCVCVRCGGNMVCVASDLPFSVAAFLYSRARPLCDHCPSEEALRSIWDYAGRKYATAAAAFAQPSAAQICAAVSSSLWSYHARTHTHVSHHTAAAAAQQQQQQQARASVRRAHIFVLCPSSRRCSLPSATA